jgi:broad specificity phosphatase PhoE
MLRRIFLVRHGRSTWNDAKTRRRFDTMLLQARVAVVRHACMLGMRRKSARA